MTSTVTITASIPVAQQGVVQVSVAQTEPHTIPVLLDDGQSTVVVLTEGQIDAIISEVPHP